MAKLISTKTAAEIMNVSRRQIQRWAEKHADEMGAQQVDNKAWVFDDDKLRAYAATREKWQRTSKD